MPWAESGQTKVYRLLKGVRMNKPISSALALSAALVGGRAMQAQPAAPAMLDPNLRVRTVVSDLGNSTADSKF